LAFRPDRRHTVCVKIITGRGNRPGSFLTQA
jgi:DNA-nicking Smr family endonuclease